MADILIYGAINSMAGDNKAAYASQVYDEEQEEFQGELNKKVVNDCAKINGYYETMGVGTATNLKGQTVTDNEFIYRKSGGSQEVATGGAYIESIKGNTLAWNQLVDTSTSSVTIISIHKYYTNVNGVKSIVTGDGSAISVTGGTDMLFDLTLIYGSGNEPSTPAQFEADYLRWFGKPLTYEPYDAGSLRNVQMQGLKTTGFNQWDEEWEVGGINVNTGENTSSTSLLRSKNTIPVLPQMSYCIHVGNILGRNIRTFYYDSDNNYIGASSSWLANNGVFSIPDNCHYIKFHICIFI